jgi:hypothetical protein
MNFNPKKLSLELSISKHRLDAIKNWFEKWLPLFLVIFLTTISIFSFIYYYQNGLGLAYNDARSRLNIGRRVVEGLKPGLAQLGSVWLPLTHLMMVPTVWHEWMWHSGLAGALQSMMAFIITASVIYTLLKKLNVSIFGRLFGVLVFITNLNILYLQSTALTELILLATMTLGAYELIRWYQTDKILYIVRSSFWIMLSTLIRYDGWFLLFVAAMLIIYKNLQEKKYKKIEGSFILFCTLGGIGVILWLLWNLMIFGDPLYFAFGPYSAHAQQNQLDQAGVLPTKHNLFVSMQMYWYAMIYNSGAFTVVLGAAGLLAIWFNKKVATKIKVVLLSLLAPLFFNILALFLGHSVLFIQGLSGDTWFNVRYGIMMMPSLAVFAGYLVDRFKVGRWVILGLFLFVSFFQFANLDAVTIDDGIVGSSQKNVTEVSSWLKNNAADQDGFIMISAASHDAIIFSSGLPMKKFIHEGTGAYWETAASAPDRWARWIVMRTNDTNDQTFKLVQKSQALDKYDLIDSYPFADIYQIKDEYLENLNTKPVLKQYR